MYIMFRKFAFIWILIFVTILGSLYVKFIYPDQSQAQENSAQVDLNKAYHLPPEQIEEWLKNHSVEEVQQLVSEHIQNEIKNGAEPVYGTISLNEDSKKIILNNQEKENEKKEENSTFAERLFQFFLNEVFSK